MAGGLLSLKWNNHTHTFLNLLENICSKDCFSDATLACDGKLYPVHKFVLSICSDYFQNIFENEQPRWQQPAGVVVVLKDITQGEVEALLSYMYLGEVNVLQENLPGLLRAAECLKIKGLAVADEKCHSKLSRAAQERRDSNAASTGGGVSTAAAAAARISSSNRGSGDKRSHPGSFDNSSSNSLSSSSGIGQQPPLKRARKSSTLDGHGVSISKGASDGAAEKTARSTSDIDAGAGDISGVGDGRQPSQLDEDTASGVNSDNGEGSPNMMKFEGCFRSDSPQLTVKPEPAGEEQQHLEDVEEGWGEGTGGNPSLLLVRDDLLPLMKQSSSEAGPTAAPSGPSRKNNSKNRLSSYQNDPMAVAARLSDEAIRAAAAAQAATVARLHLLHGAQSSVYSAPRHTTEPAEQSNFENFDDSNAFFSSFDPNASRAVREAGNDAAAALSSQGLFDASVVEADIGNCVLPSQRFLAETESGGAADSSDSRHREWLVSKLASTDDSSWRNISHKRNTRFSDEQREQIAMFCKEFGPTKAAQKLSALYGRQVYKSTVHYAYKNYLRNHPEAANEISLVGEDGTQDDGEGPPEDGLLD